MRYLFFLSFVFFSSVGFAFSMNDPAVAEYASTKTYRELLCPANSSAEEKKTCEYYEKQLGAAGMRKKPAEVSQDALGSLILSSGGTSIRLSRTGNTRDYKVNGKELDLLGAYRPEDLRSQIAQALPNQTVLEDIESGVVNKDIMASIEILIKKTQQVSSCEAVSAFVETCTDKALQLDQAIIQTATAWNDASMDLKSRQSKVARAYAEKLDKLAKDIEKQVVPFQKANVKKCGALNVTLESDFKVCRENIKAYKQSLQVMAQQLDLQRANDAIDSIEDAPSAKKAITKDSKRTKGTQ